METSISETSVYKTIARLKKEYVTPNGFLDVARIPSLYVHDGKIFQNYRKELKLTQRQLGDILEINRNRISAFENGDGANLSVLLNLANLIQKTKEELYEDLYRNEAKFSMGGKSIFLPFNVKDLKGDIVSYITPCKKNKLYIHSKGIGIELDLNARARYINSKVLNNFFNFFFIYEKIPKITFPLSSVSYNWYKSGVDLTVPISILFITEGCLDKSKRKGLIFVNNSKVLHDLLVDCIFYYYNLLPTSYFIKRNRAPKNPIYLTKYYKKSHNQIINSILDLTKNIKTAPHENETPQEYLNGIQPSLDFILKQKKDEKLIAFKLFLATEGSIYLTTRFGFIYPVAEIGCTNPNLITFLEELTKELNLNFKRVRSKRTWSGLKGVRARGMATAIKMLELNSFIPGVEISSKSKYFEGIEKGQLLLAILEFHIRQKNNKELLYLPLEDASLEIVRLIQNKELKSKEFYIKYFRENRKIWRWL